MGTNQTDCIGNAQRCVRRGPVIFRPAKGGSRLSPQAILSLFENRLPAEFLQLPVHTCSMGVNVGPRGLALLVTLPDRDDRAGP